MRKTIVVVFSIALCAGSAFAYSSASYKREGLLAQWDAIDNAGTGVHDPDATVWKDIAPKGAGAVSYDLALNATYGSWGDGKYLFVNAGPAAWGSVSAPSATIQR